MKVIYDPMLQRTTAIQVREISIGSVFTGQIGESHTGLFVRTFDGIVSLDDPAKTWGSRTLTIKDYVLREVEIRVIR